MKRTVVGKGRRRRVLEQFDVSGDVWFYANANSLDFYVNGGVHFTVKFRTIKAAIRLIEAGGKGTQSRG